MNEIRWEGLRKSGRHWISNQYDELGNCIQTVSSFGANILTSRNEMGQATQVAAYLDKEKPWVSRMEYNALGQETQRLFSNNICSAWDYDKAGRPIFHEVSNQRSKADAAHQGIWGNVVGWSDTLRRHRYEWDVNYQLKEVTNGLTKGTTVYSYDQFSNLVSAKESGFETIFRSADIVGNLYETKDCSDCIYGAGSRLEKSCINLKEKRNKYQGGYGKLITKGRQFFYDEEGNLAKKIEPDGGTWTYLYFGNGMLREVTRPDKSCVSFQYDTFGRRIEKSVTSIHSKGASEGRQQKVIRFLWNGNNLFHEWEEKSTVGRRKTENKVDFKADYILKLEKREEEKAKKEAEQGENIPDNLITWVFQDDFIPRGKITKDGNYSIISDYLGTPVEAYDEEGKKVWKRNLDIYGRVKTEEALGKKNFIPFCFQGQYEDEETGLYYNRFRYYSPEEGCYTQQDPIGLAGGNPTLYGYVYDTNIELDLLGLFKVWRNLRPDEVVSDGLSAKLPGRNMSIAGHLMNGSRHNGAQFISTTTDPKVIEKWNEPGQRIVMFDTDDVIPDVLGNKNIIDVSTPEKARAAGLKRGRPYSNAVSSKEALVEGRVPANKLTITCPG